METGVDRSVAVITAVARVTLPDSPYGLRPRSRVSSAAVAGTFPLGMIPPYFRHNSVQRLGTRKSVMRKRTIVCPRAQYVAMVALLLPIACAGISCSKGRRPIPGVVVRLLDDGTVSYVVSGYECGFLFSRSKGQELHEVEVDGNDRMALQVRGPGRHQLGSRLVEFELYTDRTIALGVEFMSENDIRLEIDGVLASSANRLHAGEHVIRLSPRGHRSDVQ